MPPVSRLSLCFILVTIVATSALSACARVRPYQRGTLSKRSMTADVDAGERRFGQHQTGSREGADGGTGEPGGGCGCN
jgi:hypothetical protein